MSGFSCDDVLSIPSKAKSSFNHNDGVKTVKRSIGIGSHGLYNVKDVGDNCGKTYFLTDSNQAYRLDGRGGNNTFIVYGENNTIDVDSNSANNKIILRNKENSVFKNFGGKLDVDNWSFDNKVIVSRGLVTDNYGAVDVHNHGGNVDVENNDVASVYVDGTGTVNAKNTSGGSIYGRVKGSVTNINSNIVQA